MVSGAGACRAPRRRADETGAVSRAFVAESRRRLQREYLPKIRRAVRTLGDDDLWWRPNPRSNSVGNLLLHLEGNVRQWILAGVARSPNRRDRDAEFSADRGRSARTLVEQLARTLREVDSVLAALGAEELLERRRIQGYSVTVLQAVYHVVEHFSGHTGQILYIVKLRRDRDLGFYSHLAPNARRRGGTRFR